jgi:hypothetical protein
LGDWGSAELGEPVADSGSSDEGEINLQHEKRIPFGLDGGYWADAFDYVSWCGGNGDWISSFAGVWED